MAKVWPLLVNEVPPAEKLSKVSVYWAETMFTKNSEDNSSKAYLVNFMIDRAFALKVGNIAVNINCFLPINCIFG